MANLHRGSVTLAAGDQEYTLSYSVNALCSLEDALDKPVTQIIELLNDERNIRMSTVRSLIWAGLIDHHEVNEEEAGRIASEAGVPACMEQVGKAMTLAFPAEAKKGQARPRKAAGAKG